MKQPLAHRMRPTNIQEIIGQQHLVGEGKFYGEWSKRIIFNL